MYRFILFYFVLYICIYVAPWSCEARHLVPLYVHTCSGMTIKLNLTWLDLYIYIQYMYIFFYIKDLSINVFKLMLTNNSDLVINAWKRNLMQNFVWNLWNQDLVRISQLLILLIQYAINLKRFETKLIYIKYSYFRCCKHNVFLCLCINLNMYGMYRLCTLTVHFSNTY